ncbi:hypothetical protein E2C01_042399 [Portunus trituberculatus]|uniref:Uncharacterized protein n=1 Tax=Portunus trituberculatus TaxID=210409 RepID=A0A5B7FTK6_PORTR|nr:hypothetical protein [Portunus trituberculatus]
MIRSKLEYVAVAWSLSSKKDIRRLEWIQRRWIQHQEDLVLVIEEVRRMRGNVKTVEKWNALSDEVATAHKFKEKLDKWRHGDKTL